MMQPAPSSPTVASAKQAPGVVDALDADYRIIDTDRRPRSLACSPFVLVAADRTPSLRCSRCCASCSSGRFIAAILGGRRPGARRSARRGEPDHRAQTRCSQPISAPGSATLRGIAGGRLDEIATPCPGSADQHQADRVSVEKIMYLLKAGDAQPIGFVHEDQAGPVPAAAGGPLAAEPALAPGQGVAISSVVHHQQFLEALLILGVLLGCERRILGAVVGSTSAAVAPTVEENSLLEDGVRRGLRL